MYLSLCIILLTASAGLDNPDLPLGGGWREAYLTVPDSSRIRIDDPWLVSGSIEVFLDDSLLLPGVDYIRHDSLRMVEFIAGGRASPGTVVLLRYRSAAVTDTLFYQLFSPAREDTSLLMSDSIRYQPRSRKLDPLGSWGGIRRSGTITRGVRFGSGDEGGVTSGLHLELSGRPASGITVDAILDDRNMPASRSGASASLAELDRLMIQVRSPHLYARLGDLDLEWKSGRYGTFSRRLKGGSAGVEYPMLRCEGGVAGGNNAYMTKSFFGRDGDQGPYELTDRLGRPGVAVSAGSEKVYLDGRLIRRGRIADYVMNYARGTITFNPDHPIRSDSRIEVEYEYNDTGYPRYFYGATAGTPASSTEGLTVGITSVAEGRDDSHPLAFEWTDRWRDVIRGAGDDPLGAQVSGIDTVGEGGGDYKWETVGKDTVLVFSPPDSIGRPTGYLNVEFSRHPEGEYSREYDPDLHAFYFHWVGADSGAWAPVRYLPLPDRVRMADINTVYRVGDLRLTGEAVVSDYDRNSLSPLDDDDNVGSAWLWSGVWGEGNDRPVTVEGSVRHEDINFHPMSRAKDVDYLYRWDIVDDTTRPETEINGGLSLRPIEKLVLTTDGGYLEQGSQFTGRRYDFGGSWNLPALTLTSGFDRTETDYREEERKSVRTGLSCGAAMHRGRLQPSYAVRSERRRVSVPGPDSGYRYLEHETGLGIIPTKGQNVQLRFTYRGDDNLVGDRVDHVSDTRIMNVNWKGESVKAVGWTVDMLRYYQTYTDTLFKPVKSTSAALETVVRPSGSPWKLRIDYNLITGSERAGAQIASYVGENHGSYRREGSRYVPDPTGDFNLHETLTDTLHRVSRINFTGVLNWSPRRRSRDADKGEFYPLGITGVNSRFEAELKTTSDDPWRAFMLYPPEFSSSGAVYADRTWLEEILFLEGEPGGDGKLTLRRRDIRDRTMAGGESSVSDRVSLRIRLKPGYGLRLKTTPFWRRIERKGIVSGETRSDVTGMGSEFDITFIPSGSSLEYGLLYGFEQREDKSPLSPPLLRGVGRIKEHRLSPRLTWNISHSGTMRFECGWRGLTSTDPSPGYDLTEGWVIGDNWTLDIGFDYSLGNNIVATAYFHGLWRGDRQPSNSALVEFTATL